MQFDVAGGSFQGDFPQPGAFHHTYLPSYRLRTDPSPESHDAGSAPLSDHEPKIGLHTDTDPPTPTYSSGPASFHYPHGQHQQVPSSFIDFSGPPVYPPQMAVADGHPSDGYLGSHSLPHPSLPGSSAMSAIPIDPHNKSGPAKAFPCSTCGKCFARRSDLARHERIHSGIKPHVCPFPDCGKKFIQRSALTVHYRVHTGEKPHMCERCSKSFSDSSSLARHRRIHSGKRPYKCPYADCQKTFTRRTTLTRHQAQHTGTVEEAAAVTAAALATRPPLPMKEAGASVYPATPPPADQAEYNRQMSVQDQSEQGRYPAPLMTGFTPMSDRSQPSPTTSTTAIVSPHPYGRSSPAPIGNGNFSSPGPSLVAGSHSRPAFTSHPQQPGYTPQPIEGGHSNGSVVSVPSMPSSEANSTFSPSGAGWNTPHSPLSTTSVDGFVYPDQQSQYGVPQNMYYPQQHTLPQQQQQQQQQQRRYGEAEMGQQVHQIHSQYDVRHV